MQVNQGRPSLHLTPAAGHGSVSQLAKGQERYQSRWCTAKVVLPPTHMHINWYRAKGRLHCQGEHAQGSCGRRCSSDAACGSPLVEVSGWTPGWLPSWRHLGPSGSIQCHTCGHNPTDSAIHDESGEGILPGRLPPVARVGVFRQRAAGAGGGRLPWNLHLPALAGLRHTCLGGSQEWVAEVPAAILMLGQVFIHLCDAMPHQVQHLQQRNRPCGTPGWSHHMNCKLLCSNWCMRQWTWTRCMALAHFVIASQSRGSRDASCSPGGGSAPGLSPLPTGLGSRSPDTCALHPVCCIHTVLCVLACTSRVSAATCSCWMSLLQPSR